MSYLSIEKIHSSRNPRVQKIRALQDNRYRRQAGLLLLEGSTVLLEAIKAGLTIVDVLISEDALDKGRLNEVLASLAAAGVRKVAAVPESVLARVSTMRTAHDLVAVARLPGNGSENGPGLTTGTRGSVLALDGLQDPGNVGTILRTALAFGFTRAWLDREGVDPYHPKVLRASAGSAFWFTELRRIHLPETLGNARAAGMTVVALDPEQGEVLGADAALGEASRRGRLVVVAGAEGDGISPAVQEQVDRWLRIPLSGPVESLNVAIATAIALYVLRDSGCDRGYGIIPPN